MLKPRRFWFTATVAVALVSHFSFAQEAPAIPRPDPAVAEFARGVKFTVAGYNGGAEALTNFPVRVRIPESGISGFRYADFNNADGSDIGFVDAEGNGLTGATLYNATTKGASVSAGRVGRARRMGDNLVDANKGAGGIDVELGGADYQTPPVRTRTRRVRRPSSGRAASA